MKKIDEDFLHFLWKNQFLAGIILTVPGNEQISVKDPGIHNQDAGPDFLNAKVEIGGTLWVGNVELHINASDWFRHKHPEDPAYDSVILHVVYFNDTEVTRLSGERIPVAVLRFPTLLWESYRHLQQKGRWIPCEERLHTLSGIQITQWTTSLMIEKLMDKTCYMEQHMNDLKGHWDAIFSRIIFRSFGIPVNTTPFEILSLLTPYNLILRNKSSIFSLESILFGISGLINTAVARDKYTEGLLIEFRRFKGKLENSTVPSQSWKFMRMRPGSFPTIRLAFLAAFIHEIYPPLSLLKEMPSPEKLHKTLKIKASDYWNTHYQPGKESKPKPKYPGKDFINTLLINGFAPFAFYYGKHTSQEKYCNYAISLLEKIPAENNVILKKWGKFGLHAGNAFQSQALLHLHKKYCVTSRCLECQFGNNLILHAREKAQ